MAVSDKVAVQRQAAYAGPTFSEKMTYGSYLALDQVLGPAPAQRSRAPRL